MKLDKEIIDVLKLTEDEVFMYNASLKDLTKEGMAMAFSVSDKVFDEIQRQKEEARAARKALTEEEQIHLEKDKMVRLKRSFYA